MILRKLGVNLSRTTYRFGPKIRNTESLHLQQMKPTIAFCTLVDRQSVVLAY